MKKPVVLPCLPLPSSGSRKSVNWAPQFKHQEKVDEAQTIKRSSSRLSSKGSVSAKPDRDCNKLQNSLKEKTKRGSPERPSDEEVPTRFVSYPSTRGKRQRETQADGAKVPKREQKSNARADPREPNNAQKTSKARSAPNLQLRNRGQTIAAQGSGKEDRTDRARDHGMRKEESQLWVSVPVVEMENVVRNRRDCQKASQLCGRFFENKTVKSETDKVSIGAFSEVCAKLPKKNDGEIDESETVDALRDMVKGLKGVVDDVGHMVENLQDRKLESAIHAEKAEYEVIAAAERQKLCDEISKLERKTQTMESERDRLKKDFVGLRDRTKEVQRLQVDKDIAQASVAALAEELANEKEKSCCQICFNNPRDAIVLPCMHFLYCNECLQAHQKRNPECPTCRGKINCVLRCNLN
ncbi:unnamed protein product [Calypogeia fissa]